jgi:type II secretory pathway component PulF
VEVLTAASRDAILGELIAKNAIPVDIRPAAQPHPLFQRHTKEYRDQFLRAMLYSIEGGMSPGMALEQLIETETGPLRPRLNVGLNLLRQGRSFLEAFEAIELYDTGTLALVRAGEETGKLPQALRSALQHLEKSNATAKLIFGAAAATAFDLVVSISSILGTRFGMIPYLRQQGVSGGTPKQQLEFNHALDLATWANDIMIAITVLFVGAVVFAISVYFGRDEELRAKLDSWLLKVPIIRDLLLHSAVSSTCSVMSSLLHGGVTFLPAVQITARSTKLFRVANYWRGAYARVEGGEMVARVVSSEPMTRNEQMILRAHQNVTQLASSFDLISRQRDEKSRVASKRFFYTALVISLLYSGLSVLLTLFVAWVQNKGAFGAIGG